MKTEGPKTRPGLGLLSVGQPARVESAVPMTTDAARSDELRVAYRSIIEPTLAGNSSAIPIEGKAQSLVETRSSQAAPAQAEISAARALALTLGLDTGFQSRIPLRYLTWLSSVRELRSTLLPLSDVALRARFDSVRAQVQGGASVKSVLPEAFALMREFSRRALGKEHYEVQLLAAMTLVDGHVAQLKTGEGKTLSAGLAAALLALEGKGCHVVTTNSYLAARDAEDLRPLYEALGLRVGVVQSGTQTYEQKREAYAADLTYGHCNTFAFDWLEDQVWWREEYRVQRPLHAAIVDEADDVLLDTAQQPLVLCGAPDPNDKLEDRQGVLRMASEIAAELDRPENVVMYFEGEKRLPKLTDEGMTRLQTLVANKTGIKDEQSEVWQVENAPLLFHVKKALEASYSVSRGREYIRDEGELVLVDDATGHPNPGGRLRHGLQDAVLIKEGREPEASLSTIGIISYQGYFTSYPHLGGTTGTARGGKEELRDLYGLQIVEVPTNKPIARVDEPDAFFPHPAIRDLAMVADVLKTHATGQPVLVSTIHVNASKRVSERLSNPLYAIAEVVVSSEPLLRKTLPMLEGGCALSDSLAAGSTDEARAELVPKVLALMLGDPAGLKALAAFLESKGLPAEIILAHQSGIPHRTLNAETHKEEAAIIGAAGQKDAVTVATQMAGRGVDIPLGEGVKELGGLRVVGVEHKTNPRKDDQARGRAGRQGTPGSSRFYVSLSDEVFSYLPAHKLRSLASRLGTDAITEPSGELRRAWEGAVTHAQKRAELNNEVERRRSTKLEAVLRSQRRSILLTRQQVLRSPELAVHLTEWVHDRLEGLARDLMKVDPRSRKLTPDEAKTVLFTLTPDGSRAPEEAVSFGELLKHADELVLEYTAAAKALLGCDDAGFNQDLRDMTLYNLDQAWIAHLLHQEQQKEAAHLSAYGERDPWVEYTRQAAGAFRDMANDVRQTVADRFMFHLQTSSQPRDTES